MIWYALLAVGTNVLGFGLGWYVACRSAEDAITRASDRTDQMADELRRQLATTSTDEKMRAALVRECKVSAGLADELNDAQIRIRRLEVELVALGRARP